MNDARTRYIAEIVADAPPLTAEQIAVCRRLFRDLPTPEAPDVAPAMPEAA